MLDNLEIRMIQDSEINEVVDFYNSCFHTNRESKHWLWEYRGLLPKSEVFVVVRDLSENNKLVGLQGMIPIFLNINGTKYLTGKSESALLHENYRKGGILFRKYNEYAISKCKERGMSCIWGMNEIGSLWKGFLGFTTTTDEMQYSILILSIFKTRSMSRQIGTTGSSRDMNENQPGIKDQLTLYWNLFKGYIRWHIKKMLTGKKQEIYSVKNEIQNSEDVNHLFQEFRKKYPNIVYIHQDANYQNWRIRNNPFVKYLTYYLYQGTKLKAYAYVSITPMGIAFFYGYHIREQGCRAIHFS